MQFGFRAGLKAYVVFLAVAYNFFDHGTHLVDFDGEDNVVLAFELVFVSRRLETCVNLVYAVVDDVGEANQHGSRNIPECQFVNKFAQIDRCTALYGLYGDVAFVVD